MTLAPWVQVVIDQLAADRALGTALARGGDLADFYWERSSTASLVLEQGRLEKVLTGMDTGASLRVLFDDRQAFASTNTLEPARLLDLAGTVARVVDRGIPAGLADLRSGVVGPRFLAKIPPAEVDVTKKIELCRRADAAARAFDSRIKQVRVVYGDRVQEVVILDSNGVVSGDRRVSVLLMVQVVAEENGRKEVGYEPVGGAMGFELFDDTSPEDLARRAAGRAILMLNAEEAPSGPMPVVLSS